METIFIPHSDYLAHHGIKNQKWGQRRFQNYDGSLTSEGRKRYGVGESNLSKREKKQAEKAAKQRAKANDKKKADALKADAEKQKRMEYLRDHPEKIYKHRKELTQEDVDTIMAQVKFDQSLKKIRKDQIDRGMKKISDIKGYADTINNVYTTSKNTWNNVAEINNALVDMGIIKNGRYFKKWGEDDFSFNKRAREKEKRAHDDLLEKKLRAGEYEDIYEHRSDWSTDDLTKAYKRYQMENLNKDMISKKDSGTQKNEGAQKKADSNEGGQIRTKYENVIKNGSTDTILDFMDDFNSAEKAMAREVIKDRERQAKSDYEVADIVDRANSWLNDNKKKR